MKKVLYILPALALAFVVSAGSAKAFFPFMQHSSNDVDVTVDNSNNASVTNNVSAKSETGDNTTGGGLQMNVLGRYFGGMNHSGGNITTGDAASSAYSNTKANRNLTTVDLCGCLGDHRGDVNVRVRSYNTASVTNNVRAKSDTGDNTASKGSITTGNALSQSESWTLLNTNVTHIGSGS